MSEQRKVAIVTGASQGIGAAIVDAYLAKGYKVVATSRTIASSDNPDVLTIQGDIGDPATARKVVTGAIERFGRIDTLVNNAGVAHIGNAENTAPEDFERVLSVNVRGVYHCLHAAIPQLRAAGGGAILNVASIVAWVGIPDRFAYSMSKGAVSAMTMSVAKDFMKDGIRCNSISPARVHTPFVDGYLAKNYPGREAEMFEKLSQTQPIGRMGTVDEVAALALFLCSDEAAFITGCDYPLDGGFIKLNN